MKKLTFFFLSLVLLVGCKKDNSSGNTPVTYRIEGVSDITIDYAPNSKTSMVLTFNPYGSFSEAIMFSFSGLPMGVSVDTTHVRKGVPVFSSFITFTNDGTAKPGTYNILLNCTGVATKSNKVYDFNLTVLPFSVSGNCNNVLAGHWSNCIDIAHTYGPVDTVLYGDEIISSGSNGVIFLNVNGVNNAAYAEVNCATHTLTFPKLPGAGYITWGDGTFTNDQIKYTFYDSFGTNLFKYEVTMNR